MRKVSLIMAGVAAMAVVVASCQPVKPPPQGSQRDVLVVGDSVSFSVGCVLGGADGVSQSDCPARPGYTTQNNWLGACTISGGTVLLYNRGTVSTPNCYNWPWIWSQWADQYQPKVVIINTAGWEVVDRWSTFSGSCDPSNAYSCGAPDEQWGGPTCTPQNPCPYFYAAAYYSNALYNAINMFRGKPWHPTVVVLNSPYFAPPRPTPPPESNPPPGIENAWWEAYKAVAPTKPPDQFTWQQPNQNVTYRSSKVKIDQFNNIVELVKNNYFASDPGVVLFDFWKHFSPGGSFNEWVCPPPADASDVPDVNHKCSGGSVNAIQARIPNEDTHLTPAGQFQILQPYLEPCVRTLLGLSGGSCAT